MTNGVALAGQQHPHAALVGAGVAVAVHVVLAVGLVLAPTARFDGTHALPVEIDVTAEQPPPPPPPEPPPSERPPPEPAPRPVVRKVVPRKLPPMPNQEKPPAPSEEPATPVFGVTADSVVAGDSPVAVAVGNTLMTDDRKLAQAPPPPLPAAPPPPAFAPVDEESVAEFPEASFKPEPEYPAIAKRMGIEGRVRVKLGIDYKGNVKSVRVLEKAGYGMDEEAVRMAWLMKFRPARRADGKPVDFVITYNFTFRSPIR